MKLWVIEYRIDGKWQEDGEWWTTKRAALSQAIENMRTNHWGYRIMPARLICNRPRVGRPRPPTPRGGGR